MSFELGCYSFETRESPDKLKLFLEAKKQEDSEDDSPSYDLLHSELAKRYEETLFSERVLRYIVLKMSRGEDVSSRRVVRGFPPKCGRDGRLVFLVKKFERPSVSLEQVDRRFMRMFDNIDEGCVLARVYPAKPGIDGKDVYGKAIRAPRPKDARPKHDRSIEFVDEGGSYAVLRAKHSGYLTEKQGQLQVRQELVIDSDIDYRTCDIDFVGRVLIKGSVQSGFSVKGLSGVRVEGDVFGGMIFSPQGDIEIQGGVFGYDAREPTESELKQFSADDESQVPLASIRCAKNLSARLMHTVSAEVGGHVRVEKELQGCVLRVHGSVVTARLFGGRLYAVCGVEAGVLGTPGEQATAVRICSDVESNFEFAGLVGKIKQLESAKHTLEAMLGVYAEKPALIAHLKGPFRMQTVKRRDQLHSVEQFLKKLYEEKEKRLSNAVYNSSQRCSFKKKLYPKVKLRFQDTEFISREEVAGPQTLEFDPESEEFVFREYRTLECDLEEKNNESKSS